MAEHAPLSFSGSERWIECPASYQESLKMPPFEGNVHTVAGSAAHLLGEETIRDLLKRDRLLTEVPDVIEWIFQSMPIPEELQGSEVEDHVAAVAEYVAFVLGLGAEGYEIYLETKVQLGEDALQLFGTADCVAIHRKHGRLIVADYKHGRGHRVIAKDNTQLLCYLAAVLDNKAFKLVGITKYVVGIVQPRARTGEAIQLEEVDFDQVWEHMDRMLETRKQALGPNPPYAMGEWCRWCPALAGCPHVRSKVEEGMKLDLKAKDGLLAALDIVETAEQWCAHVRGLGHEYLEKGGALVGWALYPKRATRKWLDVQDAANMLLSAGLEASQIMEEKLLSPAKAQKLLDAAKWQRVEDSVVVAQSSGTTLARDEPGRKPVGGEVSRATRAAERVRAMGLLKQ